MGDNGKGGVKNGWHHLWIAPDVQNKQKIKQKKIFYKIYVWNIYLPMAMTTAKIFMKGKNLIPKINV